MIARSTPIHRRRFLRLSPSSPRSTPTAAPRFCRRLLASAPSASPSFATRSIGVAVGAFGLSWRGLDRRGPLGRPDLRALSSCSPAPRSSRSSASSVRAGARCGALTALLLGSPQRPVRPAACCRCCASGAPAGRGGPLVIDESAAMALARSRRAGFWATGLAVFASLERRHAWPGDLGGALRRCAALGLDPRRGGVPRRCWRPAWTAARRGAWRSRRASWPSSPCPSRRPALRS